MFVIPLAESDVNAPVPSVVAPIVVKFAAAGAVAPIGVLLIEPVVMATPLSVPPVTATDDDPKLFAVSRPVESMVSAVFPVAITCRGLRVELAAVVRFRRYPVPVFDAVSVRFKRLFEPVAAP